MPVLLIVGPLGIDTLANVAPPPPVIDQSPDDLSRSVVLSPKLMTPSVDVIVTSEELLSKVMPLPPLTVMPVTDGVMVHESVPDEFDRSPLEDASHDSVLSALAHRIWPFVLPDSFIRFRSSTSPVKPSSLLSSAADAVTVPPVPLKS